MRWLLAYNMARMRRWPTPHLQQLKQTTEYIGGESPCPSNLRLYVQLITAAKLTPPQKERILKVDGIAVDEVEPLLRRFVACGGEGIVAGFLVGMNGYQFYLVFWDCTRTTQQMRRSERNFLRHIYGIRWLRPTLSQSVLCPSLNILDVVKENPLMRGNIERGDAWVQERSAKRI